MKLKHYFVRHTAALVSDILVPVSIVDSCVYRMVCGYLFADTLKDKLFSFTSWGNAMGTMNISRKRSAFTLIELLVVIAIIGVLVGLLLPAVQQAREAARRSACGNKMKQNALAMHTYADANRSLPSGSSRRNEGSTAQNTVWKSFTVELMPFIEMSTVYDKLDLTKHQLDGTGGANNSNWQTLAPNFQGNPIYTAQFCPSDPDSFAGRTVDGKSLGWVGHQQQPTLRWQVL